MGSQMEKVNKYTQRDWDRIVGYGKVPVEYMYDEVIEPLESNGDSGLVGRLNDEFRKRIQESFYISKADRSEND